VSRDNTQASQNVHSKLQIIASRASGGSAFPQHSQEGRKASMIDISFLQFTVGVPACFANPPTIYVNTPHITSVNARPTTETMVCNTDQT
jgi:hypothetical protein